MGRLKNRDNLVTGEGKRGGGRGAKSYNLKKALSSVLIQYSLGILAGVITSVLWPNVLIFTNPNIFNIFRLQYTLTRLYAGFRHPDRMAPDQTVRGRETFCPSRMLVFYIPPCRRTFLEFSEDLPCEKKRIWAGWDQTHVLTSTETLLYP